MQLTAQRHCGTLRRSFAQHATTMFYPHFVGDDGSRVKKKAAEVAQLK
jgi:hypothetical protein